MPESFRVLVKELQSLGLDMRVLNIEEAEIELRDMDDDDDLITVDALTKFAEQQSAKQLEKKRISRKKKRKTLFKKLKQPKTETNLSYHSDELIQLRLCCNCASHYLFQVSSDLLSSDACHLPNKLLTQLL